MNYTCPFETVGQRAADERIPPPSGDDQRGETPRRQRHRRQAHRPHRRRVRARRERGPQLCIGKAFSSISGAYDNL